MSLLVRKINKAKWFKSNINITQTNDVSADAITNCLKTTEDTLSVWQIDSAEDLEQAVLALVANQDHLDTIDVVILEQSSLNEHDLSIVASPGNTSVESLVETHRNITNLTFSKIGFIKNHIVERIRSDHIKRFTKGTLKKLINKSIKNGLIRREDLKESIQKKI